MTATLLITDGTGKVELIGGANGFHLKEWKPSIPKEKGGGVWQSSFFSDGRVPVAEGPYDNAVETFVMVANSKEQNATIRDTQELRRLARKAKDYFASGRTTDPVWIEAKAEKETNPRYAVIYGWETGPDGNPFSSPFNDCQNAAMDDFTLIIERGHWRSTEPGDSDCIAVLQPAEYVATDEYTYHSDTGTDDCTVLWDNDFLTFTPVSITLNDVYVSGGLYWDANPLNYVLYSAGIVFKNVTAPSISPWCASAKLRIVASDNVAAPTYGLMIYGFLEANTATFTTEADFGARPTTVTYVSNALSGAWTNGVMYEVDVTDIVNEIVATSGWTYGNNIGLRIDGMNFSDSYEKRFASFENVNYDPPELAIEWVSATTKQLETCDPIIVSNSYPGADVDYFYYYDNSTGVYIDLGRAYPPFNLFPNSIWANTGDILFFGCRFVFGCIVFNLGTVTGDVSGIDWEYWNGAAWADMSEQDNTDNFSILGKNCLTWSPLDNTGWAKKIINGVNAYWIRGTLTITDPTPTSPVQTRWRIKDHPIMPCIDILNNEEERLADGQTYTAGVGGDIPALMKINAEYQGQYIYLPTSGAPTGMMLGERGKDREVSASSTFAFNAFLNISDETSLPILPTRTLSLGDDCTWATYLGAPHGRACLYNPNDTLFAERVRIKLTENANGTQNYRGRFHAYLRLTSISNEFYFQLNVCGAYTEKKYYTGGSVIDFGIVEITRNRVDAVSEYTIIILGATTDGVSPGDSYLIDLILIPADQYVGKFITGGYPESCGYGESIIADSAEIVSKDIDAYITDGNLEFVMQKESQGPITVANNEMVRLWFLFSTEWPTHIFKVTLSKTQRYFSGRADR